MSAAFTKDDDPHRLLTDDERGMMRTSAEELRTRAQLVLRMADRFEAANTIGDVLAVDVEFDAQLADITRRERA